jgi:Holliday junction DNA helicase RuvA
VNGVGYGVELTLTSFASLAVEGSVVGLWIFTRVKEDVLKLYGFTSMDDRKVFDILLNVNGVGPKVALAILSTLSVWQLKAAIERREPEILETVPGIGKRTAEKILVELQSKIEKFPIGGEFDGRGSTLTAKTLDGSFVELGIQKVQDLSSALENLGFKKREFLAVLDKLVLQHSEEAFPDLMRRALALLKPLDKTTSSQDLDQLF